MPLNRAQRLSVECDTGHTRLPLTLLPNSYTFCINEERAHLCEKCEEADMVRMERVAPLPIELGSVPKGNRLARLG